jgi:hypothetical protein
MSVDDIGDVFGDMFEDNEDDNSYEYQTPIKTKEELSIDLKRKATELDVIIDSIKGRHSERFNHILMTCSDREFPNLYLNMLRYVAPSYKQIDAEKPKTKNRTLTVRHVTVKKK